jgi:hypothetical protein
MRRASGRVLICAVLSACLAARAAHAKPAGFAFLEVPAGARASALGGAYSSLASGAEAAFWNPAGLEAVQGVQVTGSHTEFLESLRHEQFAVAGRLAGGGASASLRAGYSQPVDERDELGNLIGTFGSHDLEFALGYGRPVAPGVAVGGTGQVVRERIANVSATTFAFGLGTVLEPKRWPGLRLGLSAHNLGPAAAYTIEGAKGSPVPLPAAVQAGASYRRDAFLGCTVSSSLEGRFTRGRNGVAMLGAELAHASGAALRLGFRANDEATRFGFGVGWALPVLRFDYAFVPYRLDLGDTHRVSFTAQF